MLGTFYALLAGLCWGVVFVAPVILNEYPSTLLVAGRYVAFGTIALIAAGWDWTGLKALTKADWVEALKLTVVGNFVYYFFLTTAIHRAGPSVPTLIIGTLPVVIAVTTNLRNYRPGTRIEKKLPWKHLSLSAAVMLSGIGLVNHDEWSRLDQAHLPLWTYVSGLLCAVGALACWTWYPIRNGEWLRVNTHQSSSAWATAQGLMTLPIALLMLAMVWLGLSWSQPSWSMPAGPRPEVFVLTMLAAGLIGSWLGSLFWNQASQRLSPGVAGQLIVFETLAALLYAYAYQHTWPSPVVLCGMILLFAGVLWAMRQAHVLGDQTVTTS